MTSVSLSLTLRAPRRCPARSHPAFTLTEVLAAVGIIAVLISILLPTLSRVRRSAQTVSCAANLRSILLAMQSYTREHDGYFPGGPATTARFLFTSKWADEPAYNNANCPNISQLWDWMTPLAPYLNVPVPTGGSVDERVTRFDLLRKHRAFTCPANDVLAPAFTASGGPVVPTDLAPSYAIATQFHLLPTGTGGKNGGAGRVEGSADLTPPAKYKPLITKIGLPSEKVFVADGARYSNATEPPDVDLNYDASGGGAFGDMGPWSNKTNCWDRSNAVGNAPRGPVDARIYAFRHGTRRQFGPTDSYRLNVGFFDGHVETMGDLQASNPHLWMPRRTFYNPKGNFPMPDDTAKAYGASLAANGNRIR